MRIISGTRARTALLAPADAKTTRPITDRVKESLFSILQMRLKGAVIGDLFCGTGSMGLEALSRGACHAVMMDLDHDALKRLKMNIAKLKFGEETTVVRGDIFKKGVVLPVIDGEERRCDIIFVDPPYRLAMETGEGSGLAKLLEKLSDQCAGGAVVVVRQDKRAEEMAEEYASLRVTDKRLYGTMRLTFLTHDER